MIIAAMELVPRVNKRQELLEILRFVKERVRTKAECLGCDVFETINGTPQILYQEQWRSTKDLYAHIQSGLYLRLLNAMELACEEPRISFHEVSQTRSMELIEQLRGVSRTQ